MIGYVTVGTSDLEQAARFYDPLAAELGVGRMMEFDSFIAWGDADGAPGIAATMPFDGKPASVGNGTMVALEAKDRAQVQRLYDIALANGGSTRLRPRTARRAPTITGSCSMPPIFATPTATSSMLS